ncbi:MAG: chloride channel protein [Draconibacterium sp.]|nr:chloride channel protein [Draconibacterium sp.]
MGSFRFDCSRNFLKIVATSFTFGAGGIGGIFAPTLFMGVNTGMLLLK